MASPAELPKAATNDPVGAMRLIDALNAEHSLKAYTRLVWPVLEPGRPLVYGWHMDAIVEHLEAVSRGEIRRLVINVPPGFSKALAVDTPVLTTWGWKHHGELEAGDFVFGPDGQPKRVEGKSPDRLEEAYRVTFDDGSDLVAGAGHLWDVGRDAYPGGKRTRVRTVVTTTELQAGSRGDCVDVPEAVRLGPKRLLVDPYVLGAWLGDGGKHGGTIYVADRDIETLGKLGRIARTEPPDGTRKQPYHHVRVEGLSTRLRVLGLLANKHIPEDYLEACEFQRWELLRGLMDTDGHCGPNGLPTFTNTNERLARGAWRLACSLGLKARIRERESWLNGRRYRNHWRVTFTPRPGDQIFRLDRKQIRIRATGGEPSRTAGWPHSTCVTPGRRGWRGCTRRPA